MSSYKPLPEIKIIPLITSNDESVSPQPQKGRSVKIKTATVDIRQIKIQEFLNSSNLAPNTRKVYERELRRFLNWTELLWGEIKPRHISQYKAYLTEEVRTDKDKPLSKSSINSAIPPCGQRFAIATLKSFFGWMAQFYPDLVAANPTA